MKRSKISLPTLMLLVCLLPLLGLFAYALIGGTLDPHWLPVVMILCCLAIGTFVFVLLFLILAPVPHRLHEALRIQCPYL